MASFTEAKENPVEQLWDEIDDIHAGMLGLMSGSDMHMQPMAPECGSQAQHAIWFYTKTDSHLVQALRPGSRAHFLRRRQGPRLSCLPRRHADGKQGSSQDRRILELGRRCLV